MPGAFMRSKSVFLTLATPGAFMRSRSVTASLAMPGHGYTPGDITVPGARIVYAPIRLSVLGAVPTLRGSPGRTCTSDLCLELVLLLVELVLLASHSRR